MRVLLCDDHTLFAEAFGVILAGRGHEVVRCVQTPDQAVDVVRQTPVDMCVMDLNFAAGSGIDGTARVVEASPDTRVVVLTASSDPEDFEAAIGAGAHGVARKDDDLNHVVDLVERVQRGERATHLRPSSRRRGVEPASPMPTDSMAKFLTPREREVLGHLAAGNSTAGVAQAMGVRYSTARTHIQNTLNKLGVHSRLEAVVHAVNHHLITPESGERPG